MYRGFRDYVGSRLHRAFKEIKSGKFGGDTPAFQHMIDSLVNGQDQYLVCHDF